jgi:hypothetical protein
MSDPGVVSTYCVNTSNLDSDFISIVSSILENPYYTWTIAIRGTHGRGNHSGCLSPALRFTCFPMRRAINDFVEQTIWICCGVVGGCKFSPLPRLDSETAKAMGFSFALLLLPIPLPPGSDISTKIWDLKSNGIPFSMGISCSQNSLLFSSLYHSRAALIGKLYTVTLHSFVTLTQWVIL